MAPVQLRPGDPGGAGIRRVNAAETAALADLLDRVLDRGAVLAADLVVTVAGVPLLGICLRAALGDVDAMVAHGLFAPGDPIVASRPDPPADVGWPACSGALPPRPPREGSGRPPSDPVAGGSSPGGPVPGANETGPRH